MEIVPMGRGERRVAEGLGIARSAGFPPRAAHRHAHAFHQVTVVLSNSGASEWQVGDGTARAWRPVAGDVVVCPALTPIRVHCERPFEAVSIQIAAPLLDRIAGHAGLGPVGRLAPTIRRDRFAGEIALKLAEDDSDTRDRNGLFAESLGTSLAIHLLRDYGTDHRLAGSPPVEADGFPGRVLDLIERRLDGDLSVARLAAFAGLSPYHFIRRFRTAVGTTPHQYVLSRRVERARELLEGGVGITEAALAVGFASQSHLHQHVRRLLGVTPGELASLRRRPR